MRPSRAALTSHVHPISRAHYRTRMSISAALAQVHSFISIYTNHYRTGLELNDTPYVTLLINLLYYSIPRELCYNGHCWLFIYCTPARMFRRSRLLNTHTLHLLEYSA